MLLWKAFPPQTFFWRSWKKIGGRSVSKYLVTERDKLPTERKTIQLIAGESVEAGADKSLNFLSMEGEIRDIISDNCPIGCPKNKWMRFC